MPTTIRLRLLVVPERRPARDAELWKRDPHHDQTFPRTTKKRREAAVRRSAADLRNGMDQRGLRRRIPGSRIQERRPGAIESFPRGDVAGPAGHSRTGKRLRAAA